MVAAAVWVTMGKPVLFRQVRTGRGGQAFEIIKFRTMRVPESPDGPRVPDAVRLTKTGVFLRSCSLDELPQLWNVIRGEMSLVGPRPYPVEYLQKYTPVEARRHEVKPGLTGLAQTSGRNALTWEERLALDVEYVDSHTLALDATLLLRTIWQVLTRRGVAMRGYTTSPEFRQDPS
jgi:lipopolysaccharide/colanic/teichoic acid biosynthesis glycosyltransferase